MDVSDSQAIICPTCAKRYRWRSQWAGRKLRCPCGSVVEVPASQPQPPAEPQALPESGDCGERVTIDDEPFGDADDGTYELALPDAAQPGVSAAEPSEIRSAPARKCPMCNLPMSSGAVICINCGFNLREGKAIKPKIEQPVEVADDEAADLLPPDISKDKPPLGGWLAAMTAPSATSRAIARENAMPASRGADIYLPIGLIVAGIAITSIHGHLATNTVPQLITWVGLSLAMQVFLMVPALLVAIWIIAKVMDINFGALHLALLKLAAIAVGPLALADLIAYLVLYYTFGLGIMVSWVVYIICCGPFVATMFDLDFFETAFTIAALVIVRMIVIVGLFTALIML